jgi:hypothetical protein
VQFQQESVRQIEIDVMPDSDQGGLYTYPLIRKQAGLGPLTDPELAKPGIKVMHVADYDYDTTCSTLVRCLQQVKGWSDAHPDHAPIPILLELKQTDLTLENRGGVKSPPWDAKQFDRLDNEIRSVLADQQIITPDTIRHPGLTLEQSVLKYGWPTLNQARGKFLFLMDNKDQTLQAPYLPGARTSKAASCSPTPPLAAPTPRSSKRTTRPEPTPRKSRTWSARVTSCGPGPTSRSARPPAETPAACRPRSSAAHRWSAPISRCPASPPATALTTWPSSPAGYPLAATR